MNFDDYKDALDYAIVEILDAEPLPLKFHELEEKIEKYCKISPSTLTRHLKGLARRNIVERKLLNNGRATYSLTKKFKDVSEIQRKHYPTSYWKETFALETFSGYTFEVGIPGIPRPRLKAYWPQREGAPPSWWLPSWRRQFYKNSSKKKYNRKKIT